MDELIKIIVFFLPAAFANMIQPFLVKIKFLDYPADFKLKFRKKRIFGEHKTIRGFVFGTILAIIVSYALLLLTPYIGNYYLIPYDNFVLIGFLLGFGALFGDSVKSFFKRQANIAPGKSWIPFDQMDWEIGAMVFISFIYWIGWIMAFKAVILLAILHPIINYSGYWVAKAIGIKKSKV